VIYLLRLGLSERFVHTFQERYALSRQFVRRSRERTPCACFHGRILILEGKALYRITSAIADRVQCREEESPVNQAAGPRSTSVVLDEMQMLEPISCGRDRRDQAFLFDRHMRHVQQQADPRISDGATESTPLLGGV
jgi:hypothetical protein